jgi:hypothetical protein
VKYIGTYKNTLVIEYIEGQTLTNYLKSKWHHQLWGFPFRRLAEKEAKALFS